MLWIAIVTLVLLYCLASFLIYYRLYRSVERKLGKPGLDWDGFRRRLPWYHKALRLLWIPGVYIFFSIYYLVYGAFLLGLVLAFRASGFKIDFRRNKE